VTKSRSSSKNSVQCLRRVVKVFPTFFLLFFYFYQLKLIKSIENNNLTICFTDLSNSFGAFLETLPRTRARGKVLRKAGV
jgi:hypothetical protein